MEMINAIVANFSHYNLSELFTLLCTPSFYATILMLIALEVTLSADNAIVLALLVKPLPEAQRAKALKYGIVGAYAFRFLAIGLGTLLIKFESVKIIGGGYLLYLACKYFYEMVKGKRDDNHNDVPDSIEEPFLIALMKKCGIHISPLVQAVMAVEMMDIAFSMDSVLAAFGVSSSVWVLLIGGMLGILAMRFAAGLFVKLIEKVPELETAAYALITFIGAKMVASTSYFGHIELNEWASVIAMVVAFGGAFTVNFLRKGK